MNKYNAGDILEITEDFTQLGAAYKCGDKYKVEAVTSTGYNLEPLQAGLPWSAHPGLFDPLEIVRKVEPKVEHMELGKTYKSKGNDLYYRPTEYDFEGGRVLFDYSSDPSDLFGRSKREFDFIEEEFGVLPPVKPVGVSQVALDELKDENTLTEEVDGVVIGGWDRKEFATAAPKPETVSVDALREAWDYVDHEYPDIEKLIKLAQRLS